MTFPLFAICSKLDEIPVSSEPSPWNFNACTLPSATKPVVALISLITFAVAFDLLTIPSSPRVENVGYPNSVSIVFIRYALEDISVERATPVSVVPSPKKDVAVTTF